MQAKNSTKCSLSHWDTGIILGSETGQKIPVQLQSLKLTNRSWKWMVGKWDFLLGRPIFRGYVSFREGTWQKKTKYEIPPKIHQHKQEGQSWHTTNVARGSVCFVQTWTPHLPSRCAQHPSKISGKSEGEVMPAAISPAWTPGQGNHVKVSSPYLPFLFMFFVLASSSCREISPSLRV